MFVARVLSKTNKWRYAPTKYSTATRRAKDLASPHGAKVVSSYVGGAARHRPTEASRVALRAVGGTAFAS